MDCEKTLLENLSLVERITDFICRRRHFFGADAEDFHSYVKIKLIEEHYRRFREFQGQSSLKTYLTVVIRNLFQDYLDGLEGRWRPSADAKRLGPAAVQLETLLYRDCLPFAEAIALLRTNHGMDISDEEADRIIRVLPRRTRVRLEGEEAAEELRSQVPAPDEDLEARELSGEAKKSLTLVQRTLDGMDPVDRLVFRYRFESGMTVADISKLLGLDQKALYKRIDRILSQIRKSLESEGVDSSILDAFQRTPDTGLNLNWGAKTGEEKSSGQSVQREGGQKWPSGS